MTSQASGRRWRLLAVASAANFMTILDLWVVNIAYPALERTFAPASLADVSWVLNIYAIVLAALLITAGRLADNVGRQRCFFAGLVLFGIASIACAVAPALPVLVVSRAVQAVGAAILMPTSLSFALSAFDEHSRGTAVGVWAAVGAIAASGGPVVGGLLITLNWRWIFLINVPLVAATLIAGWRSVPFDGPRLARRLDGLGAVLVFAATTLTCTALVRIGTWAAWQIGAVSLGAVLLAAAFVARVRRHPEPIVVPRLFHVRRFTSGSIGILSYYVGFAVILLGMTLLLTDVWHYSALRTALAIAPGPMAASCLAPFAGRIASRIGFRPLVTLGMTLFAVAGLWPLLVSSATPRYSLVVLPSLLLWGLCNGLVQPALFGTASTAPAADLSSASAVLTMARQLGSAFGVAVLVAVVGGASVIEASGLRRAWLIVVASAIVTALAAFDKSLEYPD